MDRRFEGRKFLVFGASSGIGRACAIQLGAQGASVILVGRSRERLEEAAGRVPEGRSAILLCDVSDFEAAQTVVKDAVALDGKKLDGCVFSAGITADIPVSSVNEEKLLIMFRTNLFSLYAILRVFASRRVSVDGASFVALSSIASLRPEKGQAIYAGTKAGINALINVAAQELAKRRIRANAVCPTMVDTPMGAAYMGKIEKCFLLGKLQPEDIADTVLFLLSDESKKITGQTVTITAGRVGRDDGSSF